MNTEPKLSPADERAYARLTPYIRRACDSRPSPAVLAAIHAAGERKVRRSHILPFVRLAAAAAAMVVVSLTGWLLRSNRFAETQRQVALMDDMLFLCAGDQPQPEAGVPSDKREDVARRLLNLQGLDGLSAPAPETAAEPLSLPSTESQSRNTPGLQAQKCG